MYLVLFLLIYLGYKNSVRARAKGYKSWTWGVITALTMFGTYIAGSMVVIGFYFRDRLELLAESDDEQYKQQFQAEIMDAIQKQPLLFVLMMMFMIGGYLIIRFVLEKKEDKTTKSIPE